MKRAKVIAPARPISSRRIEFASGLPRCLGEDGIEAGGMSVPIRDRRSAGVRGRRVEHVEPTLRVCYMGVDRRQASSSLYGDVVNALVERDLKWRKSFSPKRC